MQEVAERAGEEWRSWLIPASVDGLIVAASMVLLVRRRAGLPGGWLAWVALLGGVAASLACNIAAAEPTVTARLLASWPPLAFAAAFELLLQQRRPATRPTVEPEPIAPVDHPVSTSPTPSPTPRLHPAMSGPPIGPAAAPAAPFARVGDLVAHRSPTGRPAVDQVAGNGAVTGPLSSDGARSGDANSNASEQVNGTGSAAALRHPEAVDHPGEPSPTRQPPGDQDPPEAPAGDCDDSTGGGSSPTPEPPDDPLVDRVAALVAARPPGRPPGRRTVAQELDLSEYRAGQLLAQVTGHNGTARKEGAR
ncbi:MAG: DUF2637 domain-containing protein [Pseudonocardiaceae bacterium]